MKAILAVTYKDRDYYFRKDGVWASKREKAKVYPNVAALKAELFNARRALGHLGSLSIRAIPAAVGKARKNPGGRRKWAVRFTDGTRTVIEAATYKSARTRARLVNHSGIEDIVLQTNARKDRAKAVAAFGAMKKNPSRREHVEAADALLESFSGSRASKEIRASVRPIKTGLVIGHLQGVHYRATRDGESADYYHKFKSSSRPLLIASHDGSQLGIVGGRYEFTDHGIEDR